MALSNRSRTHFQQENEPQSMGVVGVGYEFHFDHAKAKAGN